MKNDDECRRRALARAILPLTLAIPLVGCSAELRNVSAGHVGCSPDEITISDESTGWSSASWVATCHGKRYDCSGTGSRYGGSDISCTEDSGG